MSTSLFNSIIFGPVHSRRLGLSLGVNLLPVDNKLCNFNCIYCECGWNKKGVKVKFNPAETVYAELEKRLILMTEEGQLPDVITFAGNGEPTMHPDFAAIIDRTIEIRDKYAPNTKIAVLSNATMIGKEEIREALKKADMNILKLDSAFDQTVKQLNGPAASYTVAQTVENMMMFDGKMILQTMFLRGEYEGRRVDNTSKKEVTAWLQLIDKIRPQQVMIYTIDRDTPAEDLYKVTVSEMKIIADKVRALGIECSVAES